MPMLIKRLIKGARYSDKYGSHPGTPILCFMLLVGSIGGALNKNTEDPLIGALMGFAFTLFTVGWLWLIGCWNRGDV